MGSGGWCGPGNNGSKPCHFCAWSKIALGWVTPTDIIGGPVDDQSLPAFDQNATVVRIPIDPMLDGEYFTVTNRHRRSTVPESTGFDAYLPGDGAVIMHVDDYVVGNTNESMKKVDVEAADGNTDLDTKVNRGDMFDVWNLPTQTFNDTSTPNSRDNTTASTGIIVSDFKSAGTPTMTIDASPRSPTVPAGSYSIQYDVFGADRVYTTGWGNGDDYAAVRFTTSPSHPTGAQLQRVKVYFPIATTCTVNVYDTAGWNGGWTAFSTPLATSMTGGAGPGYAEIPVAPPLTLLPSTDFYVEVRYQYSSGNPIPMTDDYTDDDRSWANDDATTYSYSKISTWGWNYDINIRADIQAAPPAVESWELY
jgi:hypothetical protein